jgi:hypothetical protein
LPSCAFFAESPEFVFGAVEPRLPRLFADSSFAPLASEEALASTVA